MALRRPDAGQEAPVNREPIEPQGERILVTGGAGFIGSTFTARVIDDNEVVILDTFARDSLRFHAGLREHKNLTVRTGSVLDEGDVAAAMQGVTQVVHCAAVAGIDSVDKRPADTMIINILGTHRVLDAAVKQGGVRRFVDFSTSEIYGTRAWKSAETDPAQVQPAEHAPRWVYAVSKLATEHLAHAYHRQHKLPVTCLRPFNVYGPRQVGEGAIQQFAKRAISGQPLYVYNEGTSIRAWCYVDDAVDALCRVLVLDAAIGESFNIGNPVTAVTVRDLAHLVARLAGRADAIENRERTQPDVELRVPDITKAREVLGFDPQVDLEEGVRRTLQWYREQG